MTGHHVEDVYTTAMRSVTKREAEHWKQVIRKLNEDIKRIEARKAQAVFELDRCIRESQS